MKSREEKEDALQKIRFDTTATFNDNGKKTQEKALILKLNELVLGDSTTLIKQESYVEYDPEIKGFKFPKFDFTSDIFITPNTPVPLKSLVLEINEVDKKKPKNKPKFIGKTQFMMRDALRKGHTAKYSLFILDEKNNFKGSIEISNCSARRHYSFFDLQLRSQLNIVPIVSVDYSLANLTFEQG